MNEAILGIMDAIGVAGLVGCFLLYYHINKLYDEVLRLNKTLCKVMEIIEYFHPLKKKKAKKK